jgi:c-di-GMP-related signal transduction protein
MDARPGCLRERLALPFVRARSCELLAPLAALGDAANDLFLLGLLSTIDAILDMKMEDVRKEITIRADIRDALLERGNPLRKIFDVELHYEHAAWKEFDRAAARLSIPAGIVSEIYLKSVEWAADVLAGAEVKETKPAQCDRKRKRRPLS